MRPAYRDDPRARPLELERERLHAMLGQERSRLADIFRLAPSLLVVMRGLELIIDGERLLRALVDQQDLVAQSLPTALKTATSNTAQAAAGRS